MEIRAIIESKERIGGGKILIIGASGLVGQRFLELFSGIFITPKSSDLDLTNAEQVKKYLEKERPRWIINFAAYTNVSEAEKQRNDKNGSCWQVNVEGTRNLVNALPKDSRLIQISTDMVFTGKDGSYKESALPETDPDKLTWYGYTKAEGERIIGDRGTIVRIIYPIRAKYDPKLDYLKKPLSLYEQNRLYPLFVDQQINITYIDELCEVLQKIINQKLTGVYHVASRDLTTPHELISYYISKVKAIDFSGIKGMIDPNRYPKYGGLDTSLTQKLLGMKFSSWKEIVEKLLATS